MTNETADIEPCEHDTLGCGWREPHERHTKAGDGRPCCGWPPRCKTAMAQVALIEMNRQEPPEQHAQYQSDDPDADYYDGPFCETCETKGPKWCEEHGRLLVAPCGHPYAEPPDEEIAPGDYHYFNGLTHCSCGRWVRPGEHTSSPDEVSP